MNSQTRITNMVSIALATYNGELYISEQLDSIANQTKLPDELVVSDDNSTDSTLDIVNEFARHVDFPVKVSINKERLGSTRNFEAAICACSGDFIFLCDQDDIWYPDKIARITEHFMNNTEIGVIFTNADVVDQNLNLLEGSLWKRRKVRQQELTEVAAHGGAFKVLLTRNFVTGATLAFRAEYRQNIVPIPKEWVHDYWIALIISISSDLAALPTPLIAYRQHSSNQIGAPSLPRDKISKTKGKSFHSIYSPKIKAFQFLLDHLIESSVSNTPEVKNKILLVKDGLAFLRVRSSLPGNRWKRLPVILQELIASSYHRYAKGTRHAAKDLLHKVCE